MELVKFFFMLAKLAKFFFMLAICLMLFLIDHRLLDIIELLKL